MSEPGPPRSPLGSKSLPLDPAWSRAAIAEVETALLRHAAFPEIAAGGGLAHEFVILDPSATPSAPAHEDLLARLVQSAARLAIPTVVVAGKPSTRFGSGGFADTTEAMAAMEGAQFASAFACLRERVSRVLAGSPPDVQRHVLVPMADAAMLTVLVELSSQLASAARPFVHLVFAADEARMANAERFAPLQRFGRALEHLNAGRPTLFLYAWSAALARRLTGALAAPVRPLDAPPELALAGDDPTLPDHLVVAAFAHGEAGAASDGLLAIVRAANAAARDPQQLRFLIEMAPAEPSASAEPAAAAMRATLEAVPERNVTILQEALGREATLAALRQVDAVLLLDPATAATRRPLAATHAMAAGKLVIVKGGDPPTGAQGSRVLRAVDEEALGRLIAELAEDLGTVRTNASVAKRAYWANARPSRFFAELLYGPLVLADAQAVI